MNDLIKTEFFCLMTENSQKATNEQVHNAYGKFIGHIDTISLKESDLTIIFRKLNITRVELVFIESLYRHEQGEKCPKICLYTKSIGYC